MALETAAAIIGILAAAGKVAETLGPIVSSFKDAPKNIAAVLSEINNSRVIISALQKYLNDLSTSSHARKELIQVDQLITTLTDGTLLFSELEELVDRIVAVQSSKISLSGRVQWAWHDNEFSLLVSRMQNFKSSVTVMLNILQCESDAEAHSSRRELIALTSMLLKNNVELSTRISHLEHCFATSQSTIRPQPHSHAPTELLLPGDSNTIRQESNDLLDPLPNSSLAVRQFETVLLKTGVYRRARRHTSDVSFRSSVGRSHAWTALAEITLSDITKISVVALPLQPRDLSNHEHYEFLPPSSEQIEPISGPKNPYTILPSPQWCAETASAIISQAKALDKTHPMRALWSQSNVHDHVQLSLFVKGSKCSHTTSFVQMFIGPGWINKKTGAYEYEISDPYRVRLDIRVLDDSPNEKEQVVNGDMSMLVYDAESETEFQCISKYYIDNLECGRPSYRPTLILAVRGDLEQPENLPLITQGQDFAARLNCHFESVFFYDIEGITRAIRNMVGRYVAGCIHDRRNELLYLISKGEKGLLRALKGRSTSLQIPTQQRLDSVREHEAGDFLYVKRDGQTVQTIDGR